MTQQVREIAAETSCHFSKELEASLFVFFILVNIGSLFSTQLWRFQKHGAKSWPVLVRAWWDVASWQLCKQESFRRAGNAEGN